MVDMLPLEETQRVVRSLEKMCDKKNSVLFTDTECLVLSPDFKLSDENQVLLRVPRENNMYNVNLRNIIPSGDLTCLLEKVTLDESNLWHRRLGHINFKTMNKLVNDNLVRGLPTKVFENDNTCVACKKDHLSKFDGKADEGFFVGYSFNSKAFRVFNSRIRTVEENLHIRFSENTYNVVSSGPDWLFDINALTRTMNYEPIVVDQEKEDDVNNTNNVNTADNVNTVSLTVNVVGTNEVNAIDVDISIELPFDPNMHALEDIGIFDFSCNDEDGGAVTDMNNLDTTIQVSPTLTIRIHKDHPIDQVIVYLHSTTQTRKMLKNLEEHGFVSYIQQKTNHKDLQNCLFASFLSQEEPKKKKDGIFSSQDKYVAEIVKKFRFTEVKTASTPMETQKPLLKDKDDEEVDVHMYRSMIGSLMYLTPARPDIMFAVCACASYQFNPKVSHLHVVKKIFRDTLTTAGSKLMMLRITYYSQLKVNAARHNLLLLGQYGKKIIITEASIRRDLQLANKEGVDYLPNSTIFEQLALIGTHKPRKPTRKVTQVPQPSDPMEHVVDEAVHKELGDSLVRAATTASSLEVEQDSGNINKTQSKATPNESSSQ
nr:ribonuclease H-like domain-containing protein [Tanacetum cinerariifolium]